MMRNMASSLIKHKRITTTLAKAKELRKYVEPVITRSKEDNMTNRRVAFRYLQDKEAVKALYGEVSEKVAERDGGYTRIIKLGTRLGDNAELALIELVDFNELYSQAKAAGKKKRRRRRGGKSSSSESSSAEETTATAAVEESTAEVEEVNTEADDRNESTAEAVETPEAEVETPSEEETKKEAPETEAQADETADADSDSDENAESEEEKKKED